MVESRQFSEGQVSKLLPTQATVTRTNLYISTGHDYIASVIRAAGWGTGAFQRSREQTQPSPFVQWAQIGRNRVVPHATVEVRRRLPQLKRGMSLAVM